jgi:hypothetical protein
MATYPLHEECENQCRSSVIVEIIESDPDVLAIADDEGYLPLHRLLANESSSIDDALMMIEKYPAALEYQNDNRELPLHIECFRQNRSSIIEKCLELYPQALAIADGMEFLPLHCSLMNNSPFVSESLSLMEEYPAALQHRIHMGMLALHLECKHRCRSSVISKCIELYPEALAEADEDGNMPLHHLLESNSSSIWDALMMIEKCPVALKHLGRGIQLPLRIECKHQFRPTLISTVIELYPEALNDIDIGIILTKVSKSNFQAYTSILIIVFAIFPAKLYDRASYVRNDIRHYPYYRRRVQNLLPRHVITQTHELDYRDLNWQPRAAVIMLLLQMKMKTRQQLK